MCKPIVIVATRGWAANSINARVRLTSQIDQLRRAMPGATGRSGRCVTFPFHIENRPGLVVVRNVSGSGQEDVVAAGRAGYSGKAPEQLTGSSQWIGQRTRIRKFSR